MHHLGLCVRIGWEAKGADAAIRAIDLAQAAGVATVGIDGVVRKEAERVGSFPGLLNYLPPADVRVCLRTPTQRRSGFARAGRSIPTPWRDRSGAR